MDWKKYGLVGFIVFLMLIFIGLGLRLALPSGIGSNSSTTAAPTIIPTNEMNQTLKPILNCMIRNYYPIGEYMNTTYFIALNTICMNATQTSGSDLCTVLATCEYLLNR